MPMTAPRSVTAMGKPGWSGSATDAASRATTPTPVISHDRLMFT